MAASGLRAHAECVSSAAPALIPPVSPTSHLRAVPDARAELVAAIRAAEQLTDRALYAEAAAALSELDVGACDFPDLALRALCAEAWARLYLGQLEPARELLERARGLSELPGFGDVDRAEVLYRLGCVRLKKSDVTLAVSLFTLALELCDRSGEACDRLRSHILEWRSRAYQLQRDWNAARMDVECALELAQARDDEHTTAHVLFQASLIAERTGQMLLACFYAEEAKEIYERLGDRPNAGRLLNNLGGLHFLLGHAEDAVAHLKSAVSVALELDNRADAAQAISSLAQVHFRTGEFQLAEAQARHALELLEGRDDFIDEIGNTQLILGQTLAERGAFDDAERLLAEADASFGRRASGSHLAAVRVAQGDLARRRGDCVRAADLYRAATELLQDFHF